MVIGVIMTEVVVLQAVVVVLLIIIARANIAVAIVLELSLYSIKALYT